MALAPLALPAVIDRIAVSVGNRVVTTSDIDREIRVTAFQNGVKPDFSPANKRTTADRMVEQTLIRREMEISRYPVPGVAEIEGDLADTRKHYRDDADFQRALAEYGITEQDLKDELLWQRTVVLFTDVRFRPGVQVSDQDIQDYFDKVEAPAARAAHPGRPVALEDFRSKIEATLAGQRVDQQVDIWLREARNRTEIVYHPEALQ